MSAKKSFLTLSLIILIILSAVGGRVCNAADANYGSVLVYDGGGSGAPIQQAMIDLGIDFDVRTPDNPVTLADLATHDILIVGRNYGDGDMSGLDPNVLAAAITGRILLTGHDPDNHLVWGLEAAATFLSQAISYCLKPGSGTGLVALGDSAGFSYLPKDEWGISTVGGLGEEIITAFTVDGNNSGVFDGLTPDDMSYWYDSYHAKFTAWGAGFVPFELGGSDGNDVVTIVRTDVTLTKIDDVDEGDCVGPGREITYTIAYSYSAGLNRPDINDINIIDYLPADVDFNLAPGGVYDSNSHTVTWNIGTLEPNESGSVTLTVKMKCPALEQYNHNRCEAGSGNIVYAKTYEDTIICCSCAELWDLGLGIVADVNKDCKVDFADFAIFALSWGKCNDPCDPDCVPNW